MPVGAGRQYTVRVRGSQIGEYTLAVTGATGIASASTAGTVSLAAAVSTTSTSSSSFDGSLVYVQRSWLQNYVADRVRLADASDEEELLIALPA